ncbi:hypothetical protein D6D19_09317 [Aureobasidium pullulans]|uniref:Rhodanese domain-containing protein n=1 Tax=Aureobasidium pullulans TaxID=5580 RepID=A0A4S8ZKH9_AURPU|nr:hypothetical protein D6D19_09317 [Aureobasidium pullulans]
MAEATLATDVPWYAGYPEARSSPATITRSDLLNMIEAGKKPGVDYILIDLRRTDHEGGTISGSINLPAQSLYPTIPTLYATFRAARIPKIIWYCGSSRGRGTRAAAWFADYLDDRHEDQVLMESIVLLEGIKGWATAGDEYNAKMQEYDAGVWKD